MHHRRRGYPGTVLNKNCSLIHFFSTLHFEFLDSTKAWHSNIFRKTLSVLLKHHSMQTCSQTIKILLFRRVTKNFLDGNDRFWKMSTYISFEAKELTKCLKNKSKILISKNLPKYMVKQVSVKNGVTEPKIVSKWSKHFNSLMRIKIFVCTYVHWWRNVKTLVCKIFVFLHH